MWTRDHLGSESACAFLRHAFGCFYNAFSKVDLEQKLFSTPLVFHKTLLSFRSAVLRYAQTIRILYLQRRYTTLRLKLPPKESRDRFKALVVPSSSSRRRSTTLSSPPPSNERSATRKQQ